MSSNFCHRTSLPRNFMLELRTAARVCATFHTQPVIHQPASPPVHTSVKPAGRAGYHRPFTPREAAALIARALHRALARLRLEHFHLLVELRRRLRERVHRLVVLASLLFARQTILLRFELETLHVRVHVR